jgi:xylan 1,4-beta-xylosidase
MSEQTAGSDKQELRRITASWRSPKGKLNAMFKKCIGAGRANEGLRADWQEQLSLTHRECGFEYIRMHGLFSDDMGVYRLDGKGKGLFNFQYIDVLLDFIVGLGMKPFIELGFMPADMASGKQTIFWWKGNTTPPEDYALWEELVRRFAAHVTERYSPEEVSTWYFEVWNEPNLDFFWAGTQADYFKLYRHSARAIKSVNARYRVGGPATAGAAWVPEMVDFCVKDGSPIDFISTHSYGVRAGFLDEFGVAGTVLDDAEFAVSGDVMQSRRYIEDSALPKLELHYTEWSSSYTPSDPIHDSYHEAAYILRKIKQSGNAADSMSYWVFTDIFEEAGPRFTPFHGGFGLLNYQGIKKSAYHAFSFLNMLGAAELDSADPQAYVCKDERGGVQILFWDYTYTHPGGGVNNQDHYRKDLPARARGKAEISLSDLPEGEYLLSLRKIGYRSNDPHTAYIDMGRPEQLTRRQAASLAEASTGEPYRSVSVSIEKGKPFTLELDFNENDVHFIALSPVVR